MADAAPTPPKIVWKKQTAAQYRAAGLTDDPHRLWVIQQLSPLYAQAVADGTIKNRKQYAQTTLLALFEKEFDFAGKNYNMGDFAESFYLILKNHYDSTHLARQSTASRTPLAHPALPTAPRATDARSVFAEQHKAEIVEAANADRANAAEAGGSTKNGAYYQNALSRLFNEAKKENADLEAELVEEANARNEKSRAKPTEEDIDANLTAAPETIAKLLKELMRKDVAYGLGDLVLFLRVGFVKRDTNRVRSFCMTVAPGDTAEEFQPPNEAEIVAAFNALLTPNAPIQLGVDAHNNVKLPAVDFDQVDAKDVRRLLKEYLLRTQPADSVIKLKDASDDEIPLESASDAVIRRHYKTLFLAQNKPVAPAPAGPLTSTDGRSSTLVAQPPPGADSEPGPIAVPVVVPPPNTSGPISPKPLPPAPAPSPPATVPSSPLTEAPASDEEERPLSPRPEGGRGAARGSGRGRGVSGRATGRGGRRAPAPIAPAEGETRSLRSKRAASPSMEKAAPKRRKLVAKGRGWEEWATESSSEDGEVEV